uniref:NAD dependent epimerase/dehydratase n=1 Tax=Fusarium oxysporum (strain Fo5176) TaxID=660025 RepID=A0A0D2YKP1_FUSOF
MRKSNTESTSPRPHRPLKALCLGLPRTGTTSLAAALSVLGLRDVHQGSTMPWSDFEFFDRAADASFPNLPTYNDKGGLTREEWDVLYAPCEAVIEPAGLFAQQLLDVYPGVKVIVSKRPYKAWSAIYKMVLGKFGAHDYQSVKARLRDVYDEHHAMLRERVSPENLLEFDVVEGWEPLCQFLDVGVPETEFPRVNDREEMKEIRKQEVRRNTTIVLGKVTGGVLLASAAVAMWSLYFRF